MTLMERNNCQPKLLFTIVVIKFIQIHSGTILCRQIIYSVQIHHSTFGRHTILVATKCN